MPTLTTSSSVVVGDSSIDAHRRVSCMIATAWLGTDTIDPEQSGSIRPAKQRGKAQGWWVCPGHDPSRWGRDGTLDPLDLRRDLVRTVRCHRPNVIVAMNHNATFGAGSLDHADQRVAGRKRFLPSPPPPPAAGSSKYPRREFSSRGKCLGRDPPTPSTSTTSTEVPSRSPSAATTI